ncbi:MAG: TolC family protein [Deltaproteobacteria bacterium]|nr:TolC family protein [Deltaproteobacteria bacterium]
MNEKRTKSAYPAWKSEGRFLGLSLIVLAIAVWLPSQLYATEREASLLEARISEKITLSDLETYALENNPGIQEAHQKWLSVLESRRIVEGYPDPELMVTYFPKPIETRLGPQDWQVTLSQKIPYPGKLTTAGKVAQADAKIFRFKLDKMVKDVVVSVKESFHEIMYIREAVASAEQQAELLKHLIETTEAAYAQDRVAFVGVVWAHSRDAELRKDVVLLEDMETTEVAKLNSLLNRPTDAPIGVLEKPAPQNATLSLEEMYRLAESHQEDIRVAEAQVEKMSAKMSLARYENRPNFKLGLFYSAIGNPDGPNRPPNSGDDALGLQFGVTIPLWSGKNKGRLNKARTAMTAAKAAKSDKVNKIRSQIRSLYFRLDNLRRIMELYSNELIPDAEAAIDASETWFLERKSSFPDFIETQSLWYTYQLALARAQADFGKNQARLGRLIGREVKAIKRLEPTY